MATKQLNTRIKVRYDTLANWNSNNPDLLKGEIAVVEIPASTNAGVVISEPAYLIKVGTGESGTTTSYGGATGQPAINKTSFKALPYVTAQAGDVYTWAKQPKLRITQDSDIHADTKTYLQNLVSGEINDTDTVYVLEFGTGENAGKIRFGSKDGKNNEATWTYVDGSTNNGWHSLGSTLSAADDSVTVSAVSSGTQTVGVQISNASQNALTLKATSGEKGLYVHETTISNGVAVNNNTNATVDIVTGIEQNSTNKYQLDVSKETVYTKHQIDTLLNPSMEFKGVLTGTGTNNAIQTADIPTTTVTKGDSYKFSIAGSVGSSSPVTVKAGDVIIALKDNPNAIIDDTTNWALIPAGDTDSDTHRAIKVDGTEILNSGISSGALNLKTGSGIYLTNANETGGHGVTIALSNSALTHLGYTDGAGINQLTKVVDDNGTPTTVQATIKEYVDNKFDGTLTTASATIASVSGNTVTLKAGITSSNQTVSNNSNSDIILANIAKTGKAVDLSTEADEYLILFGGTSWNDFIDSTVVADHTTT